VYVARRAHCGIITAGDRRRSGPNTATTILAVRGLVLPIAELDPRSIEAWRSLATRVSEPNPFFEADFVMAAARHLGQQGVSLLVAADGHEWRGCLPVRRRLGWRRLPGRWLVGWRHVYAFLGTPLLEASAELPALEAMLAAGDRLGPQLLALEWLGGDGPAAAALAEACARRGGAGPIYEAFERASIDRRPEATYLDGLSSSRRKELRRLSRRLDEQVDGGVATVDRAGSPAAVDGFLTLERSGWKGQAGTAMSSDPAHARFLHEVCATFASAGRLELLALEGGGRTLAMQCNLLAGGCLFSFKVAHDEAYGRYSPGVQLELAAIEAFHARDAATRMDSCADPGNELINRLWPDRVALFTAAVPLGPHALRPALRAGLRAHRRLALSPRAAVRLPRR